MPERHTTKRHRSLDKRPGPLFTVQTALDAMPHGVVVTDASGLVLYRNRRACELLDVAADLLAPGRLLVDVLRLPREHGGSASDPRPEWHGGAGAAEDGDASCRLIKGRWIEVRTSSLPGGGMIQTQSDVTTHADAREALRKSESQLRLILDRLPGFICVTDSNFKYTYLNDWALAYIGRPRAALIGRPISENIPADRYAEIVEFMTTAETGRTSTVESFYPATPYRPQHWFQVTQVMEQNPLDLDRACYVYAIDITRQREAEAAILIAKEEAERARALSDHLRHLADEARNDLQRLSELGRQVMASLDAGVILETLRTGLPSLMRADGVLLFDAEPNGSLHPIGDDRTDDDIDDEHSRALQHCVFGAEVVALTRRASDPVWPMAPCDSRAALVAPLTSQRGPVGLLVVYSTDPEPHSAAHFAVLETLALHVGSAISNSRAYAQLRLAQDQLVEREKMAALGSLVAGVAHELNTPIGNALLLTSTLNDRVQAPTGDGIPTEEPASALAELRQLVSKAGTMLERSLRSAAALVSSFKQVAADRVAGHRRTFDLAQMVDELTATMRAQLEAHHHQLVLEIPPGITMDSYPGALGQVLTNLVVNALQHGLEDLDSGRITIRATVDADKVMIEFSDSGHGIAKAHLRRIFEPFFTTRLGRGGTGLGLSISYNIVTALLGGSLEVNSPPGSGAVFRIRLPTTAPLHETRPTPAG